MFLSKIIAAILVAEISITNFMSFIETTFKRLLEAVILTKVVKEL